MLTTHCMSNKATWEALLHIPVAHNLRIKVLPELLTAAATAARLLKRFRCVTSTWSNQLPPSRPCPQDCAPADDRQVDSVSLSPGGQLAACTDDKGRVLLLDVRTLTFVRTWKGYRDAQCAWLHVATLDSSTSAAQQHFWQREDARVSSALDEPQTPSPEPQGEPDSPLAPVQRCDWSASHRLCTPAACKKERIRACTCIALWATVRALDHSQVQ